MECEKEKIFENTRVAVDVKSKKILSMKVTDKHVHDTKALPELIETIIESDGKLTIGKLFADGAFMITMTFLDIYLTMESCHVSK